MQVLKHWLSEPIDRFRYAKQNQLMIHSFSDKDTEALFHSVSVARFKKVERVARRKLLQLHAVSELATLRIPPGNQLEALKGDRRGQHSIRINAQWRICFVWREEGAHEVEIVDYH
jgi:proteic killer suppression protein